MYGSTNPSTSSPEQRGGSQTTRVTARKIVAGFALFACTGVVFFYTSSIPSTSSLPSLLDTPISTLDTAITSMPHCVISSRDDGFHQPCHFVNVQELPTTSQKDDLLVAKSHLHFPKDLTNDPSPLSSSSSRAILGFGGAFTEASALAFARLSPDLQHTVLDLYFNQSHYTLGRVPINSCDFSPASYNFDNVTGDVTLSHFDTNVTHDQVTMIPFIKAAQRVAPTLKLLGSPWSPPGWMKVPSKASNTSTSSSMISSATPNGLASEYHHVWATYLSAFLSAYERSGLDFWALTVQNEPMFAAPWEACVYSATTMATFVAQALGPVLEIAHPHVLLLIYDHNKASMRSYVETVYANSQAAKYIAGVAFHWYSDASRGLDGTMDYEEIEHTLALDPSKFLLGTEGCNCPGTAVHNTTLAWFRAMRYGHDILSDLAHGAVGWIDWNLLLTVEGGPNHAGNFCDAPLLVTDDNALVIQPMYHIIKHFSKYIVPGSVRVPSESRGWYTTPGAPTHLVDGLDATLSRCDNSAIQHWHNLSLSGSALQVQNASFCLTHVLKGDGAGVKLWPCWETPTQRWVRDPQTHQLSAVASPSECLTSSFPSSRLIMASCDRSRQDQRWSPQEDMTLRPTTPQKSESEKCLTAGDPVVSVVTFRTPEGQTIVTVLNEATVPLALQMPSSSFFSAWKKSILSNVTRPRVWVPAGGIMTLTW